MIEAITRSHPNQTHLHCSKSCTAHSRFARGTLLESCLLTFAFACRQQHLRSLPPRQLSFAPQQGVAEHWLEDAVPRLLQVHAHHMPLQHSTGALYSSTDTLRLHSSRVANCYDLIEVRMSMFGPW